MAAIPKKLCGENFSEKAMIARRGGAGGGERPHFLASGTWEIAKIFKKSFQKQLFLLVTFLTTPSP